MIGCVSVYIPFENIAFKQRRYLCRYTVKASGRGFWHLSRDGLYRATPVWFMRDHPKYRPNLVAFFDKQGVLRTFSNPINEYHYDAVRARLRHILPESPEKLRLVSEDASLCKNNILPIASFTYHYLSLNSTRFATESPRTRLSEQCCQQGWNIRRAVQKFNRMYMQVASQ